MVQIEPRPQTILIPQTRSIKNGNKREQLLLKVLVLKVALELKLVVKTIVVRGTGALVREGSSPSLPTNKP